MKAYPDIEKQAQLFERVEEIIPDNEPELYALIQLV